MSTLPGKIARLLLKLGAVTLRPSRPYLWTSGIRSPIYCDNRLLLSYPKARDEIIAAFLSLIRKEKISVDVVAGIATAGIPYAAILADRLKRPMLYVRPSPKTHGKASQVEGQVAKGTRVLVIEDLVSTGQSSLAAIQALRVAGAEVVNCLAIFSYGFPFALNSFQRMRCRLRTLTGLSDLLESAVSLKTITLEERELIERFAKNPKGWLGPVSPKSRNLAT